MYFGTSLELFPPRLGRRPLRVGKLETPVNMDPHTGHLILSKQFERVNTEYTTIPGDLWPPGNPAENSVRLLSFDQWPQP